MLEPRWPSINFLAAPIWADCTVLTIGVSIPVAIVGGNVAAGRNRRALQDTRFAKAQIPL
jgi:hypothetical protein